MNIKPISDLRNYGKVVEEVAPDKPVFLTKNGSGAYVLMSINDYEGFEQYKAEQRLKEEILLGLKSGEEHGWINGEELFKELRAKHDL